MAKNPIDDPFRFHFPLVPNSLSVILKNGLKKDSSLVYQAYTESFTTL